MSEPRTITIDNSTKKAIIVGIAALCLCVIGALLVVGRGSGGTSFADAARGATGTTQPGAGPTQDGGSGAFGQSNGQDGSDQDGSGQGRASFDELRQCLQDQGVTLPDPTQRGQGRQPELSDAIRQAFEACRQYLPGPPSGGGLGGPSDGNGPSGAPPLGQDGQDGQNGQNGGRDDDSTF